MRFLSSIKVFLSKIRGLKSIDSQDWETASENSSQIKENENVENIVDSSDNSGNLFFKRSLIEFDSPIDLPSYTKQRATDVFNNNSNQEYVLNKQSIPSKVCLNSSATQVSKDGSSKSWWRNGPPMSKQVNTSAREQQTNIPRRPGSRTRNEAPLRQGKGSRPQRQRPNSSQMTAPETHIRQGEGRPKSSSVEKRDGGASTRRITPPDHSFRSGAPRAKEVGHPESAPQRRKPSDELKQSPLHNQENAVDAPKNQLEESKSQLQDPDRTDRSKRQRKLSETELEVSENPKRRSSSTNQEQRRSSQREPRQPGRPTPRGPTTQRPPPRQGRAPRRFGLSEDFKASPTALAQRARMTKAVRAQLREEMKFRSFSKTELDKFFSQARDYQMGNMKLQEKFMHGVELSFVNGLLSL